MSLDVYLTTEKCEHCGREEETVFDGNITNNLSAMASAAGIYEAVWRPEQNGIETAEQLIMPLSEGIGKMKANPDEYRKYDAPNGWGLYVHFVPWLERYMEACIKYPAAKVRANL